MFLSFRHMYKKPETSMIYRTTIYREVADLLPTNTTNERAYFFRINKFLMELSRFSSNETLSHKKFKNDFHYTILGHNEQFENKINFLLTHKFICRTEDTWQGTNKRYLAFKITRHLTPIQFDVEITDVKLNKALNKLHDTIIKEEMINKTEYFNTEQIIKNYAHAHDINENSIYLEQRYKDILVRGMMEVSWEDLKVEDYVKAHSNIDYAEAQYYAIFRKYNENELNGYISEEPIAGRIHTAYTSLIKELRCKLKINGSKTIELDLSAAVPTILAKVLKLIPGGHDFVNFFEDNVDVFYEKIGEMIGDDELEKNIHRMAKSKKTKHRGEELLEKWNDSSIKISDKRRAATKPYVLSMLNSPVEYQNGDEAKPHQKFRELFPKDGIHLTNLKTIEILSNPKRFKDAKQYVKKNGKRVKNKNWGREYKNFHTNIYFLLTAEETRIFKRIWSELDRENISFLTIHDCVMVEEKNKERVLEIMNGIFSDEFEVYKIKED